MSDKQDPKSAGILSTGTIGLALTGLFLLGIILAPGSEVAVLYGGLVGTAGVVVSLLAVIGNSGRVAGVLGLLAAVLAVVVNGAVTGRF